MKQLIIKILRDITDRLDCGTSELDPKGCQKVLNTINLMEHGDQEMSKTEAAEYLGVCRATFDNYVKDGYLPRGKHLHSNTKALFWWKSDLDQFLYKQEN